MSLIHILLGYYMCLPPANAMEMSALGNSHRGAALSSSQNAMRSLFDQTSATNVPLVFSSITPSSPPVAAATELSGSTSPSPYSETSDTVPVIQQLFTQTLQILNQSEFNDEELTRYELLMASYTDDFGHYVSIPYILPSCQVMSQSLTSVVGTNEAQQIHLLTVNFLMAYDGRDDGYFIDNYPTLFERYINSNLELVTKDMRDHWILPVVAARDVVKELVLTNSPTTASPTKSPVVLTNSPITASPTKSPVATQDAGIDDAEAASNLSPPTTPVITPTTSPASFTSQFYKTSSKPSSRNSYPTADTSMHNDSTNYSVHERIYHVQSTMIIDNASSAMINSNGNLDPTAKNGWIKATQDWIRDATVQFIGGANNNETVAGYDDGTTTVTITLERYKMLQDEKDEAANQQSRMLSLFIRTKATRLSTPSKRINYLRRALASQSTAASVQLEFTSILSFHSMKESWDASKIVASGFRSVSQQTAYIDHLKNQLDCKDECSFESMKMEVDGKLITIVPSPSEAGSEVVSNAATAVDSSNGTSVVPGLKDAYLYAIIAGACVVLLLTLLGIYRRKTRLHKSKRVSNALELQEEDNVNEVEHKNKISDGSSTIESPTAGNSPGLFELITRNLLPVNGSSDDGVIKVVAPSGKLGLVVSSSPSKDTSPMIVQIKKKSVLTGKVKVGDSLLLVDDVDCRGMTALEVSNLIASRSQQPERIFVLTRG